MIKWKRFEEKGLDYLLRGIRKGEEFCLLKNQVKKSWISYLKNYIC